MIKIIVAHGMTQELLESYSLKTQDIHALKRRIFGALEEEGNTVVTVVVEEKYPKSLYFEALPRTQEAYYE